MKKYSCIIDSLPGKIDNLYDYASEKDYEIGDVVKVKFNNSDHLAFIFKIEKKILEKDLNIIDNDIICSDVFNIDDTKIINFYVKKYNFGFFEMVKRLVDLNDYNYNWKNQIFKPKKSNNYLVIETEKVGSRAELKIKQYQLTKMLKEEKIIRLEKREKKRRDYTNYVFNNLNITKMGYLSDLLKNNYEAENIIIDLNLIDNNLSFETIVADAKFILATRKINFEQINILSSTAVYKKINYDDYRNELKKIKNKNVSVIINDHITEFSGYLSDVEFRASNIFLQKELLATMKPQTKVIRVSESLLFNNEISGTVIVLGDYTNQKIRQILSKNDQISEVLHFGERKSIYRKNIIIIKSKIEQEAFSAASKLVKILKRRAIETIFKKSYYDIFKNSVCYKIELTDEIPYNLLFQFQETVKVKIYFRNEVK